MIKCTLDFFTPLHFEESNGYSYITANICTISIKIAEYCERLALELISKHAAGVKGGLWL